MTFLNRELPEWFVVELNKLSPKPTFDHVVWLLLEDYLKRNEPNDNPQWDPDTEDIVHDKWDPEG